MLVGFVFIAFIGLLICFEFLKLFIRSSINMRDTDHIVENNIADELISLNKASLTFLNGHGLELLKEAAKAIQTAVEKISCLEEHIKRQIDAKNNLDSDFKCTPSDNRTEQLIELNSEYSLGNGLEKESPYNRCPSFTRYFEEPKKQLYFDINGPRFTRDAVMEAFAVHGIKPTDLRIYHKELHSFGFIYLPDEAATEEALKLSMRVNIDGYYIKVRPMRDRTVKRPFAPPTADQNIFHEGGMSCDGLDLNLSIGPNSRPRRISTVTEDDFDTNIIPPLLPTEEMVDRLTIQQQNLDRNKRRQRRNNMRQSFIDCRAREMKRQRTESYDENLREPTNTSNPPRWDLFNIFFPNKKPRESYWRDKNNKASKQNKKKPGKKNKAKQKKK